MSVQFDHLKRTAKQVQVEDETLYIVEGDLALDEDQLEIYAANQEAQQFERRHNLAPGTLAEGVAHLAPIPESDALIGILSQDGRIVRWPVGKKLTYCVLRDTFLSEERYALVCKNMKQATEDWENVCGVEFQHCRELDSSKGTANPGVVFTVREIDAQGKFLAAAFFPTDPVSRHRVLIDGTYFDPKVRFNKVGILRHELGHVLGFRHEHICSGAPPACPGEDTSGTTSLTAYDPRSVMHYFCGGVGSTELELTELDRAGAQKLYGPPLGIFSFVEV